MARAATQSDLIREYVRKNFIDPARKHGQGSTRVVAGDVHAGLQLRNRVPMVCSALRSKELLREAGVRIIKDSGPPSGQSTTVEITYEFLSKGSDSASLGEAENATFLLLRGVARESFQSLGGGAKFIRTERARFLDKGEPE